jgi:NitT/TauT family transport system substrate-binding protein
MDTLDLVAEGAGFYRDEGLAVEKVLVSGVTEAAEIVASGAGDICPIGIEPVMTGYERGVALQVFLARMGTYTYVLAVLDDSPIRTLADFRGAKVGVHQLGAVPLSGQTAAETMLATAGLRRGDDYELAELTSRRVAAAAFPFYELFPYVVGGTKLRTFRHPELADVVNAGYAASPATIASRGDALARFSRAIVKAALLVRWVPEPTARVMLRTVGAPFTERDVAVYAEMFELWQNELPARDPANPRIGYIDPAGVERYCRLIAGYGLTNSVVPVQAILTNQFIAFANTFDRPALEAHARTL